MGSEQVSEGLWEQRAVTYFKVDYPGIFTEGLKDTTGKKSC
jgi:hypothetical protein